MIDFKPLEYVLAYIVNFAGRRGASTFQPLPTGVQEYFSRQVISDEELKNMFPPLRG